MQQLGSSGNRAASNPLAFRSKTRPRGYSNPESMKTEFLCFITSDQDLIKEIQKNGSTKSRIIEIFGELPESVLKHVVRKESRVTHSVIFLNPREDLTEISDHLSSQGYIARTINRSPAETLKWIDSFLNKMD